jgi:hypothetical protein
MDCIQELIISSVKGFLVKYNFMTPVRDTRLEEEGVEEEEPRNPLKRRPAQPLSPVKDPRSPSHRGIHTEPEIFASLRPEVRA